jgi:hypothetical protein
MKKALVFEGQIVQIEAVPFPVAPALTWVDAPDDVSMETHVFDGTAVVVKPHPTAELLAKAKAAARAELIAIDLASIRSMREWIAAQATAPQILKDREAAAVVARSKL